MIRAGMAMLVAGAMLAACVPVRQPVAVVAPPAPAPLPPRVEPARAINLLYEHNFASNLARRIAGACPAITVNSGAIANGEATVRRAITESRLSDADVRSRLDSVSQSRLANDLAAFTSQTGIRFSDPASNCAVARSQIAGGSRIGAYLSEVPDTALPIEPPAPAASIGAEPIEGFGAPEAPVAPTTPESPAGVVDDI